MHNKFSYIPNSHLDLYWLGNYQTTLARGNVIIKEALDRLQTHHEESFMIDTVIFLEHFLKCYPEYKSIVQEHWREQRLDIGCAYVDRWENLIQGESLIRNIVIGRQVLESISGIVSPMATHPDLPGMINQIGQIYNSVGVKYYVTTRKIYINGKIWVSVSPDGSKIVVLNLPFHYIYFGLDGKFADWLAGKKIDPQAIIDSFPGGEAILAGGAGDLCSRDTFIERYGSSLQAHIERHRKLFPQYEYTYTTPTRFLNEFSDTTKYTYPSHNGEIPSVWGVACDETNKFFQQDRLFERLIITAEKLSTLTKLAGGNFLPATWTEWQGKYYELAFFKQKDNFEKKEDVFRKLWEMIIFTQDHNGGGYEGALSTFQKQVIQDRGIAYCNSIIETCLASNRDTLRIFNPSIQNFSGVLKVSIPKDWQNNHVRLTTQQGEILHTQCDAQYIYIQLKNIQGLGINTLQIQKCDELRKTVANVTQTDSEWLINTNFTSIAVSKQTGNISMITHNSQCAKGLDIGQLYIIEEIGNDVNLRTDANNKITEEFKALIDYEEGELYKKIVIEKEILHAQVRQEYIVWNATGELTIRCKIFWWGARRKQLRMCIMKTEDRTRVTYGTPFYANNYAEQISEACPRNPDELLLEDFYSYREIQNWVASEYQGLKALILTDHPAIHTDQENISAVLLRTAPSCGDARFFWENAGEQNWNFDYCFHDSKNIKEYGTTMSERILNPPVTFLADGEKTNITPASNMLCISGDVRLSALYFAHDAKSIVLRLFNGHDHEQNVKLTGEIFSGKNIYISNPMEEKINVTTNTITIRPWGIETLLIV